MEKKDKDKTNDMFVWPKRAINKILFSWLINKPQGVLGRLPQHFKHLVLEQSTKTQDPLDILWAADKSEGSPPYFLRKIKQNMVILYQTGGGAAEGSFFVRRGDAMSVAWGSLNQTATTIINYGRKKSPKPFISEAECARLSTTKWLPLCLTLLCLFPSNSRCSLSYSVLFKNKNEIIFIIMIKTYSSKNSNRGRTARSKRPLDWKEGMG